MISARFVWLYVLLVQAITNYNKENMIWKKNDPTTTWRQFVCHKIMLSKVLLNNNVEQAVVKHF